MISFIDVLNHFQLAAPVLIGFVFISTYLVFNFGFISKFVIKKDFDLITRKEYLWRFYARNIILIILSPILHFLTALSYSHSLYGPIDLFSLSSYAPDFFIFQIGVTIYLFIWMSIGYMFPIKAIKEVIILPLGFFVMRTVPKASKNWVFLKLFLRNLSLMSWLAIFFTSIAILILERI